MKITNTLIIIASAAFCMLASFTGAQCPQACYGENTALGFDALVDLTTGTANTAIGYRALELLTSASNNTATGVYALLDNTSGHENTANGTEALRSNTTGNNNTAVGFAAMLGDQVNFNSTGSDNTAIGYNALASYSTGTSNTALGSQTLYSNTTGIWNTASGYNTLYGNTTGNFNTADGLQALYSNTTGGSNTACGLYALYGNTTGSNNIALGDLAGSNLTTGSNNIDIGNAGVAAESNIIRMGTGGTQTATFVAGIRGVAVAGGQPVAVSASGQLGVRASSAGFKENIKPMDKSSEAILSLKPVAFRYKKELDPKGEAQFGLLAEEVAKVNPDLVARDDQGKPFSVRYEEVNAMLLNEFLKEHRKVEEQVRLNQRQQATVAELKSQLLALSATVNEQAAQIRKVRPQVPLTKPAPRLVVDK